MILFILFDLYRKITSLNRELRANIIKAKQETKKIMPQEFSKNPFDILCE